VVATLAFGLGLTFFGRKLPAPLGRDAAPERFSAARAHEIVAEIARAPHPVGTPENARVRAALVERLTALGLAPEEQRGRASGVELVNLVARVPGTESSGTLLCLAHYDSVPSGPGAGDDSVGVAAWLEALRALRARGWRPKNDVVLVLTDAEERGLLGAYVFASQHALAADVACVVNLEAIGNGGPAVLFELGLENGAAVRAFARAVAAPTGTSLGDAVYRRMPNDTDLTVFRHRGLPGFNLALTSGSPAYHAPHDTPENLDRRSLQHLGECALGLVEHLGAADLGALRAPDVTFFDVLGFGLVRYSRRLEQVVAGLALVLALLASARAHAKGREVLELALRHGLEVAAVAAGTTALGWVLDASVAALVEPPEWIPGNTTSGALLFAGAFALALAAESRLGATQSGSQPARAGTLALLWSAAALAALRWLPGASFVFAWPAIFAALGVLATLARPRTPAREAVLVLGLAAALVLGLPILHLLLQLFLRAPLVALAATSAVLVSGAALFTRPLQNARAAVPWFQRLALALGVLSLAASVLVARVLEWRQGSLLP
jgi:hypothetical protein